MNRKEQINKVIVTWIQEGSNNPASLQSRKYKDANEAEKFINRLPERGITHVRKNIITDISFE